jgi:hypothetical protein
MADAENSDSIRVSNNARFKIFGSPHKIAGRGEVRGGRHSTLITHSIARLTEMRLGKQWSVVGGQLGVSAHQTWTISVVLGGRQSDNQQARAIDKLNF